MSDEGRVLMLTVWTSGAVDVHHEPNMTKQQWLEALSQIEDAAKRMRQREIEFES